MEGDILMLGGNQRTSFCNCNISGAVITEWKEIERSGKREIWQPSCNYYYGHFAVQ